MNNENNIKNEKPFNFWKFITLVFLGLILIVSIIIGIPYLLMK